MFGEKQGLGQSSLPKWVLWTIEFIWVLENPLNCHDKIISSQILFFRDPFLTPKRSPGQNVDLGIQNPILGSKNQPLGMKKQKMRAEKPCRTQALELQMEPYSASYGQKPFWRVSSKFGPEKSDFVMEWFCHGSSGKSQDPNEFYCP